MSQATNNDILPQIYLKWKFLCAYLCQNWQYFCNSYIRIIFLHQKGVNCTFFSELYSQILGVKNENIASFRDWLMPILSFTPKDLISAKSDLPGHFCWCQNWFTKFSKIYGFCVSTTVPNPHYEPYYIMNYFCDINM